MKATWPGAMARRIGLSGEIDYAVSRVGLTLHVPCAKGGHIVDVLVEPGLHPDFVAKRMLGKGWTFGSVLACPECSKRRARRANLPEETDVATAAKEGARSGGEMSDAARKAHRFVMMMLEEGYDENRRTYRDGWSDERIASETGASVTHVRDTRESFFGPVADPVPPEFHALRADLDALRADLGQSFADLRKRAEDMATRLTGIATKNKWKVP